MLGIGIDQWMMGMWTPHFTPGIAGDTATDIYGTAISVGSVVKLVGIVTAIHLNDPHFSDVVVMPIHPNGQAQVMDSGGGNPQSRDIPVPNQLLSKKRYGFHPLQLEVGR